VQFYKAPCRRCRSVLPKHFFAPRYAKSSSRRFPLAPLHKGRGSFPLDSLLHSSIFLSTSLRQDGSIVSAIGSGASTGWLESASNYLIPPRGRRLPIGAAEMNDSWQKLRTDQARPKTSADEASQRRVRASAPPGGPSRLEVRQGFREPSASGRTPACPRKERTAPRNHASYSRLATTTEHLTGAESQTGNSFWRSSLGQSSSASKRIRIASGLY